MANNAQSRKWNLVINNPDLCELDHTAIRELLDKFFPKYYCLADEIAKTGTKHTHIFIYSESPIRFTTLKNRFPIAHIEKTYGTCKENRDYILKEGKWIDTDKVETKVEGSFEEYGQCPDPKSETETSKVELINLLKDGKSNSEILEKFPEYVFRVKDIDYLRNSILENDYSKEFRKVEVAYLYGDVPNANKIKYIYQKHKDERICLISDFDQTIKFDSYQNHQVLVIEFKSNLMPINSILNLMNGVPVQLPARYSNKQSNFNYLYLVATSSPDEQYVVAKGDNPKLWEEFKNGFNSILEFKSNKTIIDVITGEVITRKDKNEKEEI